jgi:5-hydroxyisourate hydrolase-like protein (transthyretin family)
MRILILATLALVSTTTIAFAHGGPELTVSPDTAAAGASIRVKGMAIGENVLIVVTLESDSTSIALGTVQGDREGGFEQEFVIPAKTAAGNYQVRAVSADGRVARAPIKVLEAGASPSASVAKTQLILGERNGQLSARLLDSSGNPVAGQVITFTQHTTFGTLVLGAKRTDQNGNAEMAHPNTVLRETEFGAEFAGSAKYAENRALMTLHSGVQGAYSDIPTSLITPNPPLSIVAGFLLLVGGVWSVYAFAAYNLLQLWREGKQAA